MNIPEFIKLPIARFVNKEAGSYITTGVSAAMGFLASFIPAHFGVEFKPDTQAQISLAATVFFTGIVNGLIQRWQTGNAKALQDALGLQTVDGYIGPVTIRKAELATDSDVKATLASIGGSTQTGTMRGK
jgi:hypothetical protein